MTKRPFSAEVFSSRLKEILKEKGMLHKELEAAAGLRPNTVKQYASGNRIPDRENLTKIAKALGVSENWLKGESEYRTDREQTRAHMKEQFREFKKRYDSPDGFIECTKLIRKAITVLGYDVSDDPDTGYNGASFAAVLSVEFTRELIRQCEDNLRKKE